MAFKQNHSDYTQVLEHDQDGPETKKVSLYGWDVDNLQKVKLAVNSSGTLPTPTGSSTSAKQDSQIAPETSLNSLIETLQELSQRLAPLGGAMSNTAQLRAVVTGAVTATGGGYVTSAQVIAALLTQTNTLRLDPNNTLAINSNINNVAIT